MTTVDVTQLEQRVSAAEARLDRCGGACNGRASQRRVAVDVGPVHLPDAHVDVQPPSVQKSRGAVSIQWSTAKTVVGWGSVLSLIALLAVPRIMEYTGPPQPPIPVVDTYVDHAARIVWIGPEATSDHRAFALEMMAQGWRVELVNGGVLVAADTDDDTDQPEVTPAPPAPAPSIDVQRLRAQIREAMRQATDLHDNASELLLDEQEQPYRDHLTTLAAALALCGEDGAP